MTKVLITGATGNIGTEVIKSLSKLNYLNIYAGVKDLNKDKIKLANYNIQFSQFDFTDLKSHKSALEGCNVLFLLRPPQIADVEKYFKPIIESAIEKDINHIVFLSVQGVEKSTFIPHHKIEKLIVDSKIPYTFLRPAYFMQNFTTTLRNDLINNKLIYLPAGKAKFTLIDVRDIGAVAAIILSDVSLHVNRTYELTSNEKLSFDEMASKLSKHLGIHIQYKSPNLIEFFMTKRKEKMPTMFILVMIMLHYFPRFQKEPETTDLVEKIAGRKPTSFDQYILDNKQLLVQ